MEPIKIEDSMGKSLITVRDDGSIGIDYTYTPKAPPEFITVNITLDKFTEMVKKELGL